MRRPTIRELNNTISAIRESFPFSDDAEIDLYNVYSNDQSDTLTLREIDSNTDADVMISKKILFEVKDDKL
jgi:hypothetical protein